MTTLPGPAPPLRNIKLTIVYDGTDFHGWQWQPGLRTVQGVLEERLGRFTGAAPTCNAAGRTDAGVHALGQVVNFRTESRHSTATFHKALNATLPRDVKVESVEEAPESFHATLSAVSKRYRYVIDNGPHADPFRLRTSWHVFRELDVESMRCAAGALLGTHDFRCFETHYPNRATSVRTITDLVVDRAGPLVTIEVEADGFLYNMVRAITGTLVLVGTGKRPAGWAGEVLAARSRVAAGPTAPPQGLFLVRVRYE